MKKKAGSADDTSGDIVVGIILSIMLTAITWFGVSFSAPWIWIPFGSILVLSFAGGFIDALWTARHSDSP